MSLGKGAAFAALGAVVGLAVWLSLIRLTGWSLWVLAPIVGGAAGFGMMRGTQMKGGVLAGVIAAGLTIAAIFAGRWVVVSQFVQDRLAITEDDAREAVTHEVAAELEAREIEVLDEEGDYNDEVRYKAHKRWEAMSDHDREMMIAQMQEESEQAAVVLTPLTLLFDFGLFGTMCAALAAGTAFKTASMRLEDALVGKGMASAGEATAMAASMRREDAGLSPVSRDEGEAETSGAGSVFGAGWRPPPIKDDVKPIRAKSAGPEAPREAA